MSRLIGLYPAAWRARYGDELAQLILDRPPSLADRIDLARGALDARLHPQLDGPSRVPDRRGYAPLAGLVAMALAILAWENSPIVHDDFGTYRDGSAILPLIIGAMVLLCIGLYAVIERLPADARRARAAGWIAMAAGVLWSIAPWLMAVGLTFLMALLVFSVDARRAGILGVPVEVGLVLAAAVPAGLFLAALFLPWYAFRVSGLSSLAILLPLAAIWALIGLSVRRGWPPRTVAPLGEARLS